MYELQLQLQLQLYIIFYCILSFLDYSIFKLQHHFFCIFIISSAFNFTVNSSFCCKTLMSSIMNLLLKSYIISWIINTLTIACKINYLQLTVSTSELSCFSVTLWWSVMKLICMQCWLQIYCLTKVKFKNYQKFEWHQNVA